MEFLSFFVVVLLMLGFLGTVAFVTAMNRVEGVAAMLFFLATLFFLSSASYNAFRQGVLAERTLNPIHNYIVKAKKDDRSGMPLLVYDMVDKKDRVIDLKGYPPEEFSEVLTADGKIMLVPK